MGVNVSRNINTEELSFKSKSILLLLFLTIIFSIGKCIRSDMKQAVIDNEKYELRREMNKSKLVKYVVINVQEAKGGWNAIKPFTYIKIDGELKKLRGLWGCVGDTIETNMQWIIDNEAYNWQVN